MVDAFLADPTGHASFSRVPEPEHLRHLGVPVFGDDGKVVQIEEKPETRPSYYGVTGIYCYEAERLRHHRRPRPVRPRRARDHRRQQPLRRQGRDGPRRAGRLLGDAGESIEAYYAVNDFVRQNGANMA